MRELLPKYSAARTLQTVNNFCNASSRVGCDEQVNVVGHDFHSFDEHPVLLCRGVENMLASLLHFANKDFAAVLRAEHNVVRQVEDGSCVLDVPTVLWLLVICQVVCKLTCRLKATVRRLFHYRLLAHALRCS